MNQYRKTSHCNRRLPKTSCLTFVYLQVLNVTVKERWWKWQCLAAPLSLADWRLVPNLPHLWVKVCAALGVHLEKCCLEIFSSPDQSCISHILSQCQVPRGYPVQRWTILEILSLTIIDTHKKSRVAQSEARGPTRWKQQTRTSQKLDFSYFLCDKLSTQTQSSLLSWHASKPQ